ncbi:energy transducer TonB [Rhodobacteraceae bacterium RKSG542]|nr:energy transducer TonB [Pseudovibrio flavus]
MNEPEVAAVPVPRAAPPRPKVTQSKKPPKVAGAAHNSVKGAQGKQVKGEAKASGKRNQSAESGNADRENYKGRLIRKLERAVQRSYPSKARRRGLEGSVVVSFSVEPSGSISGLRVVRGSGNPLFDKAALAAVKRAAPFGKFPNSLGSKPMGLRLPIDFKMK